MNNKNIKYINIHKYPINENIFSGKILKSISFISMSDILFNIKKGDIINLIYSHVDNEIEYDFGNYEVDNVVNNLIIFKLNDKQIEKYVDDISKEIELLKNQKKLIDNIIGNLELDRKENCPHTHKTKYFVVDGKEETIHWVFSKEKCIKCGQIFIINQNEEKERK